MESSAVSPSAAAYEAQLRIRREAEAMSIAQKDLNSWMSEMKSNKLKSNTTLHVNDVESSNTKALAKKASVHIEEDLPASSYAGDSFEEERRRGNALFSKKRYSDAIECYTRCLGYEQSLQSPIIYSNRAMAHLKLKHWSNAESDATAALNIDPNHSKSHQRRCAARLSLGKIRAAVVDSFAAEDCSLRGNGCDEATLKEIRDLQGKAGRALVAAVGRAPRRKIRVDVIGA